VEKWTLLAKTRCLSLCFCCRRRDVKYYIIKEKELAACVSAFYKKRRLSAPALFNAGKSRDFEQINIRAPLSLSLTLCQRKCTSKEREREEPQKATYL